MIGIGAGPATSGQVLVFHDLLGITTGRMAKFVKQYAHDHDEMVGGMRRYVDEVRSRPFPEPQARLRGGARRARRAEALPRTGESDFS
jgi:3-methyl-2-oxobutanoate hydroxymethyltransferase